MFPVLSVDPWRIDPEMCHNLHLNAKLDTSINAALTASDWQGGDFGPRRILRPVAAAMAPARLAVHHAAVVLRRNSNRLKL
jgi:hypothetical protein